MYDQLVLVDHFNGKRPADDPDVRRQFLLLRQQAEVDWRETYAGKDTRTTVDIIEEDYVYNARMVAKTQRKFRMGKWIVAIVILVILALYYELR